MYKSNKTAMYIPWVHIFAAWQVMQHNRENNIPLWQRLKNGGGL